jgi:Nuclease-related domain
MREAENATGTTGTRGRAGASARAEYERRRAKDEARRRAAFGRLAPLVRILTGPKRTTETWGRGADGEERIGGWLDDVVGRHGVVLHDRAVRGRRINLDHIVVVPSGIWVVDSKHYRGTLERRDSVGWFVARPRLFVAGRDRTALATAASRQQALVAEALGAGPLIRAALCFTGVERARFTRPFIVQGVLVTWPKALARTLAAPGSLGLAERGALADRLARAFPPYTG